MEDMDRREWLRRGLLYCAMGGTTLVGAGMIGDLWLSGGRFASPHWIDLLALGSLKEDGVYPFPKTRIALMLRRGMLGALSLECTHLGCLVSSVDQGFLCPCHGSEFGSSGEVLAGPARESLKWYDVQLRRGRIWICTERKIPDPRWVSIQEDKGGTTRHKGHGS